MKALKVGLVGFGVAAKFMHAPFLKTLEQYKIVSVLERHEEASKELFPDAVVVRDMDALLATDIDLVIITTPNETHLPYALQSLHAGKHTVVEKPFTITSGDALQLIDAATKSGSVLSVYQNRRYVSDFLTLKDIIDKNLLGDVHEFTAQYDRFRPEARPNAWREKDKPGSGIFYDLGAHLIDQALCLFGLPKTITADLRKQRPHAVVDDYFNVWLDYGFTKVVLHGSMLVREQGPRYMIQGTKGSFIKYGEDPQEQRLRAGELPTDKNWGIEDESIFGLLHTEINGEVVKERYPSKQGNYGGFYIDLYNTIVNGAALQVQPEQAYNTIKLIELGFLSNEKKATIACEGLLKTA